jgi:hypothetical protein
VINAQSNFMVKQQQALLTREQVRQSKVDTRRRNIDQWMYERDVLPTLEDERERSRRQEYRRSLNDPPLTEIWSGKALNDLLLAAQGMHASLGPGPVVPLNAETLSQVNVTSGKNPGGVGVLKDGGRLRWPLVFEDQAFEAERKKVDELTRSAMQQAESGRVDAATINGLTKTVDAMGKRLRQQVAATDVNDYIEAKRYLRDLDNAVKLFKDPNASNYLSSKWQPRANTVAELVDQMTSQGLRFAPAAPGEEAAYTSLQRAMATYDTRFNQMVARAPSPGQ